ncbi:hypothetical protein [Serinicoccus kebangsaanensis]|uniref:hypothetical protein n=1 Tax=Serinicoccus kebangsaanensis TaxID=2602069 RepID=UPI00124BFEA3|nr:hypothetical protein [Serinicoccus kebangsaanensis]
MVTRWSGGLLWLLTGGAGTLALLSLPSIGLLLVPLVGLGAVLAVRGDARSFPWALVGAAGPLLWVAWRHRQGPGEHCRRADGVTGCGELLDPWPFLVAALAAVAVAATLFALRRGRRSAGVP